VKFGSSTLYTHLWPICMAELLAHLACCVISQDLNPDAFWRSKYFNPTMVIKTFSFSKIHCFQVHHQNLELRWDNIILTGNGSEAQVAQQSLVLPVHVANRTLPQWLLPSISANELRSCSRPGALILYYQLAAE